MRAYERSGVSVDQCGECRGIFLDRGELERLIDAEQSWHASDRPRQQPHYDEPRYDDRRHDERHYDDRRYDERRGYGEHYPPRRKKKKSFLDELFD